MKETEKIRLSDYKEYPFEIRSISLNISIKNDYVEVVSIYDIKSKSNYEDSLILQGIDIEIKIQQS